MKNERKVQNVQAQVHAKSAERRLNLILLGALNAHTGHFHDDSTDAIQEINATVRKGDLKDISLFKNIEQICFDILNSDEKDISALAADTLLQSTDTYYEHVGLFSNALNLEHRVLAYSIEENDAKTQRRVHNCLSVRYARFCEFAKVCDHVEKACALANDAGNPFYIFASLVNTVAAMESMGLLQSARHLAIKLIEQPHLNEFYEHLHLINANNGAKVCHALNDLDTEDIFYKIASDAIEGCGTLVSELTAAYYHSAKVNWLIRQGNAKLALRSTDDVLVGSTSMKNIRVRVILISAQAEARLALEDRNGIRESSCVLQDLLEPTRNIAVHYEEVLRLLVRLHKKNAKSARLESRKNTLMYLRLLREHLISVKHRKFYSEELKRLSLTVDKSLNLTNPSYEIPDWGLVGFKDLSLRSAKQKKGESVCSCDLDTLPLDVARLSGGYIETRQRSKQYDAAENWSIAAALAIGADSKHCFRVGRLASIIAQELGFSHVQATRFDLACRLHDIGNIAVAISDTDASDYRRYGQVSQMCEHTIFGQMLLGSSADEVFVMASLIAKSHHEWWNGGGYPLGLKRDLIPIEGRICAIADTFLMLLQRRPDGISFGVSRACDQMVAMAGVQLDPGLVKTLTDLVAHDSEAHGLTVKALGSRDHLSAPKGRFQLSRVLELAD